MSPPDVVAGCGARISRSVSSTERASDQVAEAGREALDLRLDRRRSCRASSRTARGSRPTPLCLPAGARLASKTAGLRRAARTGGRACRPGHGLLARRDLLERAAEVHGARARATSGARPRDRSVERPVELEDAGPVAIAARARARSAPAAAGPRFATSWRGVTSSRGARRLVELVDPTRRSARSRSLPPRDAQRSRRARRPPLRAAARHRPADLVARSARARARTLRSAGLVERQHRVRAAAREQRPRPLSVEARARQPLRRAQPRAAEARQHERVARRAQRPEDRAQRAHRRRAPADSNSRRYASPVGAAEPGRGLVDRAFAA